jgi:hypothetical protein
MEISNKNTNGSADPIKPGNGLHAEINPKAAKRLEEMNSQQLKKKNELNRFLNNYFGWFTVILVIAILVGSYYLLLRPKYDLILETINTSLNEKKQLLPKYRDFGNYQALLKVYNELSNENIQKINDLIPAEYIKEDLFIELVYIVSKRGMVVESLDITKVGAAETAAAASAAATPATPAGNTRTRSASQPTAASTIEIAPGVGTMTARMSVSKVDYEKLKILLVTLEDSLRLFDIKKLTFDPEKKTVDLELATYYFKK